MAELTPQQHQKSATIKPTAGYPRGRFPMPDANHARLALSMLGRAKGLSSGQKSTIKAAAERRLGK